MSFLGKRSRSQRSFSKGDDEITVTRIRPDPINFASASASTSTSTPKPDPILSPRSSWSSCSNADVSDFAVHESCVLRKFPKHKSSHLKFLAWVAYIRKYTNEPITEEERRTCPLLWCRRVFNNQEAMLEHVWECPELSKGLYWCFHCKKPERIGKSECRRCQGAPSRTDRMAHVAKKIFSKLGARPHRKNSGSSMQQSSEESAKLIEPDLARYEDCLSQVPRFEDAQNEWNNQYPQELPNTSIGPEMSGDWAAASVELPDSYISEMPGTECPIELAIGSESWENNFYAENLEEWDTPPIPTKMKHNSPKLAINTACVQQAPLNMYNGCSPISPQNYSANWNTTPFSASMISPMSPQGAFSRFEYNNLQVSPTDSLASENTLFTDSGYSTQSSWDLEVLTSGINKTMPKKRAQEDFGNVSEDWINNIPLCKPSEVPLQQPFPITVQMMPNMATSFLQPVQSIVAERPQLSSPHWNSDQSLVHAFSEALDAHLAHTKSALKQLPTTSVTAELLGLSKSTLTSIGLEVLAGILEGRNPTAMVQIFAFTHIACALTLAVDNDEDKLHSGSWFRDSLAWTQGLASDRQRQLYMQIARTIWQPCDVPEQDYSWASTPLSEHTNYLLSSCKHFLDVFESFGVSRDNTSPTRCTFDFARQTFEYRSKLKVTDDLMRTPSIEPFMQGIAAIKDRLSRGKISSTRDLELELLCIGKLSSQSDTAYQRYVEHVTSSCDDLYFEEMGRTNSRTTHHIQDISEIKQLLPEDLFLDEEPIQNHIRETPREEDDLLLDLDFDPLVDAADIKAYIEAFSKDADEILNPNFNFSNNLNFGSSSSSQPVSRNSSFHSAHSYQVPQSRQIYQNQASSNTSRIHTPQHQQLFSSSSTSTPTPPIFQSAILSPPPPTFTTNQASPTKAAPPSSSDILPSSAPTPRLSTKYKCHCGYEPSGEERWKPSNLRRHIRTQHSSKVYKCRHAGCKSVFSRTDNLRAHERDKGHGRGDKGKNVDVDNAGDRGRFAVGEKLRDGDGEGGEDEDEVRFGGMGDSIVRGKRRRLGEGEEGRSSREL